MATSDINNYITRRYNRWLDYAKYHCAQNNMHDEAIDVINEVLCSLLSKSDCLLNQLLRTKKNGYTELDFFVLRMIKTNITSPTSQYRNRYKPIPADSNIDYTQLELEDQESPDRDEAGEILNRMHQVRLAYESLNLSDQARQVFEFHFFQGNNFSEWTGPETIKQLYEIYNSVLYLIRAKIKGEFIF